MQYLTDGHEKYIWFTVTGQEQLFDLDRDPAELEDLAASSAQRARLLVWRERMVQTLAGRSEDGLVENGRLKAGVQLPPVRGGERHVER